MSQFDFVVGMILLSFPRVAAARGIPDYPFEVSLSPRESGLPKPSKAQAQQIRTIAKERLRGDASGTPNSTLMRKADDGMRFHLDL